MNNLNYRQFDIDFYKEKIEKLDMEIEILEKRKEHYKEKLRKRRGE